MLVNTESADFLTRYYLAPLKDLKLGGNALTIVASGFLNPSKNSDGAAFGLFVASAKGGKLLELPLATSISSNYKIELNFNVFPNPASGNLNIEVKGATAQISQIEIIDLTGKQIMLENFQNRTGMQKMNISSLKNGLYFIQLKNENTPLGSKSVLVNQ